MVYITSPVVYIFSPGFRKKRHRIGKWYNKNKSVCKNLWPEKEQSGQCTNLAKEVKMTKIFSFFLLFATLGLQLARRWCTERVRIKSVGNLTLLHDLLLICTPTCPPHHVRATQELLAFVNVIKCISKG